MSKTTIHGGCSFIFGLPFVAAGVFIVLLGYGKIEADPSKIHAPMYVIKIIGFVFGGAGLSLLVHGLKGMRLESARKRVQKMKPDEPWAFDHGWNPREISDGNLGKAFQSLFGLVFFSIFMVPFNWIAFFKDGPKGGIQFGNFIAIFVIGIFDLVLIGIFCYTIYIFMRAFKYGATKLEFRRFPYFLGSELDAVFCASKPIKGMKSLHCTLRYIEEAYEVRGSGKNRSQRVVLYQVYGDELEIAVDPRDMMGKVEIPIRFELPQGEFENKLRERPAKYWHLELKAETPGVDFHAAFLLPVYKLPA